MALYIEGLHPIAGGHLIRSGALVPGLRGRNEVQTLWVGPYTTIQGGVHHEGTVVLGRGSVAWNHVRAGPELILGAECVIAGDVIAEGRIVIQAGARVDGTVRAGSDVLLLGDCRVNQVVAGGDIVIVGAPKTGDLQPAGRVRTRGW